ncbi:MAG: polysaccharide ABC transporter ATP-binding protein, partial [Armatimonadota bacterium]
MSSKSDIAISVRGIGKSYTIAHNQAEHSTAAEALIHRLRHPFVRAERETFWALKDVSFDIAKGDVVGVIGRNGAGKSTLLNVLSRITEPTEGEIDLYGRVGSLLEVGTGFHPELTGRENIYLNGAILGMKRREIEREFDAIVDFSGVEQFLDTPVKRYSSGMYVRLAFAVAAHLRSEILVVDEVLAVGDAEFQKKCLGKMKDVATGGRTVLFVSHNMGAVVNLCASALHLTAGRVGSAGQARDVVNAYLSAFEQGDGSITNVQNRDGTGEFRFTEVTPSSTQFGCDEEKVVSFVLRRFRPFEGRLIVFCRIVDQEGVLVTNCDSRLHGGSFKAQEEVRGTLRFRTPWLKPGTYRLDMFVGSAGVMDKCWHACTINVPPILPYADAADSTAMTDGVVLPDFHYSDDSAKLRGDESAEGSQTCASS